MSTGHQGFATVHANSAENTIERLITLFKRDIKSTRYSEEFIERILVNSIDYIVYIENYKIVKIINCIYEYEKLKPLFKICYERGKV